MYEYWIKRAKGLKADLEHVKRKLETAPDDVTLKRTKIMLAEEYMIAIEAQEKFAQA